MNESLEVRIPPQSLEAERAVLGIMLLGKSAADRVFRKLREENFYREVHRRLFRAAYEIWKRKEPVDITLVGNALLKNGDFEAVGGYSGLAGLMDGNHNAANVDYYADIVLEKSALRGIIASATRIVGDAYADSKTFGDLASDIRHIANSALDAAVGAQEFDDDPYRRVEEAIRELRENRSGTKNRFIKTGFPRFDQIFGGVERSKMTLITGFKSSAKSVFCQQTSQQIAEMNIPVGYAMLDVARSEVDLRMACRLAGVSYKNLWSLDPAVMSEEKFNRVMMYMEMMKEYPIYCVGQDQIGRDHGKFCLWARQVVERRGVQIIFVDSGKEFKSRKDRNSSDESAITDLINDLNEIPVQLNIALVVISEKSRNGMAKGSGSWDYTNRYHYDFSQDTEDKTLIHVRTEKDSNGENGGCFGFRLRGEHFTLTEINPDDYKPAADEQPDYGDRRPPGRP